MEIIKSRIAQLKYELSDPEITDKGKVENKLEAYMECRKYVDELLKSHTDVLDALIECREEIYSAEYDRAFNYYYTEKMADRSASKKVRNIDKVIQIASCIK